MPEKYKLDETDINKLKEARKLLISVYEFNYISYRSRSPVNRLFTIVKKIDNIIKESEQNG